ncbi:cysteine protease LapG [Pseudomonas sp. NPDC007930]|uniref:cysteine protease LapG n=1 Tax=Pseudomonas sp. NPDC007930 TaxID=3364417 RepID=UPI0036EFACCC
MALPLPDHRCTAHPFPVRGTGWLLCILLALPVGGWAVPDWNFNTVLSRAEARYGQLGSADERLRAWEAMLERSQSLPERQQLEAVNRFFNRQLSFRSDQQVWGVEDYWATPVEALVKGAGDCEDYAIAKYFSLRRLGVPAQNLRITYVKALQQRNQAHMVLTWYSEPSADPLVLDNLRGEILPASQRDDLLPVYAFSAEGVFIAANDGGQVPSGDAKRLSRWQDVLHKMNAEGFAVGEG